MRVNTATFPEHALFPTQNNLIATLVVSAPKIRAHLNRTTGERVGSRLRERQRVVSPLFLLGVPNKFLTVSSCNFALKSATVGVTSTSANTLLFHFTATLTMASDRCLLLLWRACCPGCAISRARHKDPAWIFAVCLVHPPFHPDSPLRNSKFAKQLHRFFQTFSTSTPPLHPPRPHTYSVLTPHTRTRGHLRKG